MTSTLPPQFLRGDPSACARGISLGARTRGGDHGRRRSSAGSATRSRIPTWDDYTASAVLMPESVEQIQEIVRIANERKVPLWTHATGMNNGYGGPAPRLQGSVIVSLRRMNRVLEINEDSAYAVVEPGVRWFDLYDAVQAGRPQAHGLDPRPRLGQRRRQHPRERRDVPPGRARTWRQAAAWRSCWRTARS